ncbi:hypothetical protein CC1G_03044 [Coprinopsis cinerea okayama7|uniref:RING-type domain-containing protein n=1 Tax=Coprinopsis cinerea (strain Okayama-7 / 130 / ATCC MYA-4618 / FGSC 9003) TaxID=240176 RepID=A8PEP7_COPC7|nr:hypothetical protein CC1G_03044 [Coprinopsis cinerea okayama7\|eukprot:XP_001840815.2 hypothetical protein CC1G_03044 [Coprinopsis cinerea okayama7\
MGQSSSRVRPEAPSSRTTQPRHLEHQRQQPAASTSTSIPPSTPDEFGDMETPTEPISTRNSRRSSFRKSVMNLVRATSLKDKAESLNERRKSWRSSRRWSKSPMEFTPPQPVVEESSNSEAQHTTATPTAQAPTPLSDKGKEPERYPQDIPQDVVDSEHPEERPSDRPSTPYPAPSGSDHQPSSHQTVTAWLEEQLEAESSPANTANDDDNESNPAQNPPVPEPQPTPVAAQTPTPPVHSSTTAAPTNSTAPNPSPRAFPPPGTLVVVQGIVHTTDVTRNDSAVPFSENITRGVPRTPDAPPGPASISSSRSSSEESSTPNNSTGVTTPEEAEEYASAPVESVFGERARTPAISPGSIDVLGTLLSVAAAATAASLLTGSAEQPPAASNDSSSNGSTDGESTTSTDGSNSAPVTATADTYLAGRAERMRQAWSTIRERLGLRPNPPAHPPSSTASLSGASTTTAGLMAANSSSNQVTDTRELMLAEMARAFNIGLGLNGTAPGGATPSPTSPNSPSSPGFGVLGTMEPSSTTPPSTDGSSPTTTTTREGTLPPEGSFDRFLVDLQADLRVALSQSDEEAAAEEEERRRRRELLEQAHETTTTVTYVDGQRGSRTTVTSSGSRSTSPVPSLSPSDSVSETGEPIREEDVPRRRIGVTLGGVEEDSEDEDDQSTVQQGGSRKDRDGDYDDMPPLQDISDDSSSSDEEEEQEETQEREDASDDIFARLEALMEQHEEQAAIRAMATVDEEQRNAGPSSSSGNSSAPAETPSTSQEQPADASASSSTQPAGPGSTAPSTTAGGSGRMDSAGRINWWRLYRFPSITAPRIVGAPSGTAPTSGTGDSTTAPSPTSPPAGALRATPATTPSTTTTTQNSGPTPFLPNFLPPPPGQTVVPVIVVGLQSVTAAWHDDVPAVTSTVSTGPSPLSTASEDIVAPRRASEDGDRASARSVPREVVEDDDDYGFGSGFGGGYINSSPTTTTNNNTTSTSPPRTTPAVDPRPAWARSPRYRDLYSHHGYEYTNEEIENDPYGYPPINFDDDDDEDENDEEDEAYFDAQRRSSSRRTRRQAVRNSTDGGVRSPASSPTSTGASAGAAPGGGAASRRASLAGSAASHVHGAPPSGARTFLIYVIGGYYPPDHAIVTGGLENFESFEALLELAEMLGHARAPTVTKEDIEKAGLEIIKPWQLSQYEDEGRVAYNCIERCLICLDDYDHEDDIRIMNCRHAFHKDCVDKWLQTGKNNCPACRSTGVKTESATASA